VSAWRPGVRPGRSSRNPHGSAGTQGQQQAGLLSSPIAKAALAGIAAMAIKKVLGAARYYGNGREYMKIFEANRDVLTDPDRIRAGERLRIP
jgi:hypothetical protein